MSRRGGRHEGGGVADTREEGWRHEGGGVADTRGVEDKEK